jgi:hypothetical protein
MLTEYSHNQAISFSYSFISDSLNVDFKKVEINLGMSIIFKCVDYKVD